MKAVIKARKRVLLEHLREGALEEGNVRKVDYKGYTITVHKNRAGMFTAKNDSGEPYTNVPQFRSEEEAIAWDKKNVDQMTESSSLGRTRVRYGVFSRGGSVGSKHSGPVETFDNVEDAKQYAARLRKTLTPGERSYYRMGYVVKALKETKENIHTKNYPDTAEAAIEFLAKASSFRPRHLSKPASNGPGTWKFSLRKPGHPGTAVIVYFKNDRVGQQFNDFEVMESLKEAREVYASDAFKKALAKAKLNSDWYIPELEELYDIVYDTISEPTEDFKDVIRYKATEEDVYGIIRDLQI